jgi:Flagellar assembly protein T, C-terminal domain
MKPVMRWWPIALVIVAVTGAGCSKATSTMRSLAGLDPKDDPSVTLKSAETRWLLIKNPRFGDVPSEPEYIWVEEDKVPLTVKTLVFGKGSIIAPPEIVAKYSSPPGGGKISPRQGGPYQVAGSQPRASASPPAGPAAAPAPPVLQGYVVFVDTTRIVIDLTGRDGIRPGAIVSLRRDKIPIVHPVTGEILGELDEEVGTARVTEVRDKFSVAEIQSVENGSKIQIKDRVVLK